MTDAADLLNMSNRQLWLVCDVLDAARAWRAAFYGMEPTLEVNRLAVIVLDAVRALNEEAGQ